jgi:hypothetical protein
MNEVLYPQTKNFIKWRYNTKGSIKQRPSKWDLTKGFHESDEFMKARPLNGSMAGMHYMKSKGYKIYVLTEMPKAYKKNANAWLQSCFGDCIADTITVDNYMSKHKLCDAIGVDMVIDHDLRVCMECESTHIRGINFIGDPIYPWCIDNELAVRNWDDIICSQFF